MARTRSGLTTNMRLNFCCGFRFWKLHAVSLTKSSSKLIKTPTKSSIVYDFGFSTNHIIIRTVSFVILIQFELVAHFDS